MAGPGSVSWQEVRRDEFYSLVADPAHATATPLTVTDRLLVQVIHAAPTQRRVKVSFKADLGYLTSKCLVTPVAP